MAHVLRQSAAEYNFLDFVPYGYDERQYCSPGFDLPVGLFQRSQFGTFPEYHTSADNLDFIRPQYLADSYRLILKALEIIELDRRMVNLSPKGEPQLKRRGLYSGFGSGKDAMKRNMAVLWVLNLSDGQHSVLDIAVRADLPFDELPPPPRPPSRSSTCCRKLRRPFKTEMARRNELCLRRCFLSRSLNTGIRCQRLARPAMPNLRSRRLVAERRMKMHVIVVPSPLIDNDLRLAERRKYLPVGGDRRAAAR